MKKMKKMISLLTVFALVFSLIPLQVNADPMPNPPRVEIHTYYPDDEESVEPIVVGPGDTFQATVRFDIETLSSELAYLMDFDITFPNNELTLIGLQAWPYVIDPNTGIPINLTDEYYPNDTGQLHFQFNTNPEGLEPFPSQMVVLTFQVKNAPTEGMYNIQTSNVVVQGINGQIMDYQLFPGIVQISEGEIHELNVEIEAPVYGATPQTTVETSDYSANIQWREVSDDGAILQGDEITEYDANTSYAAIIQLRLKGNPPYDRHSVSPSVNGEGHNGLFYPPNDPAILGIIRVFPRTEDVPRIEGGVTLSTITPGFGDTNPIVANAFSSSPNALPFHYRWYRDDVLIPNSDNSMHTVVLADIGKQLRVEVYSDNYSGFLTSPSTAVVTKGEQNVTPPVPAELTATANSITVVNRQQFQEYGISTSADIEPTEWGYGGFDNLIENTDYYVFTRLAGTPGLNPGPAVSTHIRTGRIEQIITGPDNIAIHINESLDLDTLFESNLSGANFTYDLVSNTADGTVLSDNTLQAGSNGGEAVIRVSSDESAEYTAAVKEFTVLVSEKMISEFNAGFTDAVEKHNGDDPFTKTASLQTGDGAITYSSDNTDVATVDASTGEVTIIGTGEAHITAQAAETDDYTGAQQSYLLTVLKANLVINYLPTAVVNHGASLSEASFTGGEVVSEKTGEVVPGTWHFTSNDVVYSGSNARYTAAFTPTNDADYYITLTQEILPTINNVTGPITVTGSSYDDDDDDDYIYDYGPIVDNDSANDDTASEALIRKFFPNIDFSEFTPIDEYGSIRVREGEDVMITLNTGVSLYLPSGSSINVDGTITIADGQIAQLETNAGFEFELTEDLVMVADEDIPQGYYLETATEIVDVPIDSYYYNAVKYGISHGLFMGTSRGQFLFDPDMVMDRAMLVTVLHRLSGDEFDSQAQNFDDVPRQAYYYQPVQWAYNEGLVSGYGNGLFGSNDLLTREQMATILFRFLQKSGKLKPTKLDADFIESNQISDYAKVGANFCYSNGIMGKSGNGEFSPKAYVTRAEAALIMKNLIEYYESQSKKAE